MAYHTQINVQNNHNHSYASAKIQDPCLELEYVSCTEVCVKREMCFYSLFFKGVFYHCFCFFFFFKCVRCYGIDHVFFSPGIPLLKS